MGTVKYFLQNTTGLTAETIAAALKQGATFIVFKYRVSLLAVSYQRLSPAILIRNAEERNAFRKKYNRKALLLGPWFFPSGPYFVYDSVRFNNSGGMDVTRDILANLEHFDHHEQSVEMYVVDTVFTPIPKEDLKELERAILEFCTDYNGIREVYAGKYVNVDKYSEPPYMIGVDTHKELQVIEQELRPLVYKRFHDFVQFIFFTKASDPVNFEKIQRQGQAIKKAGATS
jgi:hypothetical protein